MAGGVCVGYTTWNYKVAILALKNGLPSQKNNIYGPKLDIEGAEKNDSEIRRLAVSLSSPPPLHYQSSYKTFIQFYTFSFISCFPHHRPCSFSDSQDKG
jgi:hypothetical protein